MKALANLTRHEALLRYAAQCEEEARATDDAEMYEEALQARAAALALETETTA